MRTWLRWTGGALLGSLLSTGAWERARAAPPSGQEIASRDASEASASDPTLPPTPIADSVEPAVERFVRERLSPCGGVRGVPCFPVTLEVEGRRYSVREDLENLRLDSRPVPGTLPTHADMIQQGANPHPASASVGFDPKALACKTRQLLRKIQGKSRTYYLYRVWDKTGERALLRDQPMDPEVAAASPHMQYVALGEFGDECAAMRAYLRSTHQIRVRREAQGPPPEPLPGLERQSGQIPE